MVLISYRYTGADGTITSLRTGFGARPPANVDRNGTDFNAVAAPEITPWNGAPTAPKAGFNAARLPRPTAPEMGFHAASPPNPAPRSPALIGSDLTGTATLIGKMIGPFFKLATI